MRSLFVQLLVLVAVGVVAPAALAEEPPFEATMPARLGGDANGDGLIDYANSAAELEAAEMRRGGFQVDFAVRHDLCRKGATYSWQSAAGTTVEAGGAGCGVSQVFPREGSYPVELEIRSPGGRVQRFQREATVQDWLVVSIGDSVASGEGNPDVPGSVKRARWQSARCHRSAKAGPAQAALGLEAADPETSTTFVHLACSGARIDAGLLGGYEGIEPEQPPLPAQVDELEEIDAVRPVDAVLLSVGANDVYFGSIVKFCLLHVDCMSKPFEPEEDPNPPPGEPRQLREVVSEALARLPADYAELAQRLATVVAPSHVVVVDYFDPTNGSDGQPCKQIGSLLPGPFLKIDRSEAAWASNGILEPLNGKIDEAARSAGWTEVTGVADAFRTHGYCADESWIRRLNESISLQHGRTVFSFIAGMLHPNGEGHRQEAALIGRDLDTVLYGEGHEGVESGGGGGNDDDGISDPVLIGLGAVGAAGVIGAGAYVTRRRRQGGPATATEAPAAAPPDPPRDGEAQPSAPAPPGRKIHGRYLADGFLLEAARLLAEASDQHPDGRLLHDSDRVVLFTALATEAHINQAIETALSAAAHGPAKTLPIKEKLRLVPDLAGATVSFDPGQEPLQGLNNLINRRNALVHAEPDIWGLKPVEPPSTGLSIETPKETWGTPLPTAAKWLLSLSLYLDRLADGGVDAWRDQAYLARELLAHGDALLDWDPARDGPALRTLVEHLVSADFDEE